MQILWENPKARYTTKEIWDYVCSQMDNGVSRATVYHFLDEMKEKNIINCDLGTGRGGMRVLFYSDYTKKRFKEMIAENLVQSINENLEPVTPSGPQ